MCVDAILSKELYRGTCVGIIPSKELYRVTCKGLIIRRGLNPGTLPDIILF